MKFAKLHSTLGLQVIFVLQTFYLLSLIGLNKFNKIECGASYKFPHTFEMPYLEGNLIELHAPMNNKRAVLDNRLQNGTVFPNIYLIIWP